MVSTTHVIDQAIFCGCDYQHKETQKVTKVSNDYLQCLA
ncbi:hypothetical protein E23_00511 [Faustovirus]|nr:hypothetical protein D5a_00508 [Faustovirus]AMN85394.1 hypothetical protein E23_00511 [Faustovirus]